MPLLRGAVVPAGGLPRILGYAGSLRAGLPHPVLGLGVALTGSDGKPLRRRRSVRHHPEPTLEGDGYLELGLNVVLQRGLHV